MHFKFSLLALGAALAGCAQMPTARPAAGHAAINEPVVTRADYSFDVAAPYGSLAPSEAARLDGWFRGLNIGHGDRISVEGGSASVREDIARVAGTYGLLISDGAPVTAGQPAAGSARVVVSRTVASVPGCPNWSRPSQPNFDNAMLPNMGCAVNSNLAAMVADPQDLVRGRDGSSVSDGFAGAKAIEMYRNWPLTGVVEGQAMRPLDKADTKKED